MQREVPSPSHPNGKPVAASARSSARYEAHRALEADIMNLKALKREAIKHSAFALLTPSSPNPNPDTPKPGVSASPVWSSEGGSSCHAFDPTAEAVLAADRVTRDAMDCLRLFSDKEKLGEISSKGMPTWEALYRVRKNLEGGKAGNASTLNVRVDTFLQHVAEAQCGAYPPRLSLLAARLLQRCHQYAAAAALLQQSIAHLIDFLSSERQAAEGAGGIAPAGGPECLINSPHSEGEAATLQAAAACEERFKLAVSRGAYGYTVKGAGMSSSTLSVLSGNAASAQRDGEKDLLMLLYLEMECAAQADQPSAASLLLSRTRETVSSLQYCSHSLAETLEQHREWIERAISKEAREKLIEKEAACHSEKVMNEEWKKEIFVQREKRSKTEALGVRQNAAAVAERENRSSKPQEAARSGSSRLSPLASLGSAIRSYLFSVPTGSAKVVLLFSLVLTLLAVLVRVGMSLNFSNAVSLRSRPSSLTLTL